ncbi:helix-turn-helix domain-containing protein [Streptomyces lichenis]|uniref:Helix-turn-helix transcriptional regulator n=1 Tax=Streptomyces lichenis TaxID=2306967 RepID=A0ABT0I6I9_9ACTN|nr:helix-turn-helix transcriptional regulator [Streptomyces lichenis]MCK8676934.1 helix-turn-helix transcriptional regulator [Streptomyces lichenis]
MAKGSKEAKLATWKFWGDELRERRDALGWTQDELGKKVFVSGAYIGQLETAFRRPQLELSIRLDQVLQTDGIFERVYLNLIEMLPYAQYFKHAAHLETVATRICEFAPTVVPGLLQTAEYARAVTIATHPFATEEFVEETVTSRMDRSKIMAAPTRPEYWVILHENVLRVPVGGPAVMAEQLEQIAARVRARELLLTVIPCATGAHASMGGMLTLMEFEDIPPAGYTETGFSGMLLDDPEVVQTAQRTYDLLRAAALPPEASLKLIDSAAEDYRRCARTT